MSGTAVTPEAYPRLHALIRLAEASLYEVAPAAVAVHSYETHATAERLAEHEAVVAALTDDDFAAIGQPQRAIRRYEAMCLSAESPQSWQDLDELIAHILC